MLHHYDYIITGAGCAGSSLLMRMMQETFFRDKKILIIDQSPKTANDRTWCFWEKEPDIFESIVYHSWDQLNFFSITFSKSLQILPYQYKMIRGIDLYTHVREISVSHPNIEWLYEPVVAIGNENEKATVELSSQTITADYIFNSIIFEQPVIPLHKHFLWQHFTGWMIETVQPCFTPDTATLMDFRLRQEHGTSFMYVLPVSPTKALIEYTVFSAQLLQQEEYETALRKYIAAHFSPHLYTIRHVESGKIPMTNIDFPSKENRIYHIGAAGGQVKGSSGYAFRFIQKQTSTIVTSLVKKGKPKTTVASAKFRFYDSVLLNILRHQTMPGDEIFTRMFRKNKPEQILRFLDNETSIWSDMKIMRSLPTRIFLPAGWQELKKMI